MNKKHHVVMDGLKMPMKKVWDIYSKLYTLAGGVPTITDAVADRKNQFSLHPHGYALDLRIRHIDIGKALLLRELLKEFLGGDYDVIMYSTHIHVEYQRFLDDGEDWNFSVFESVD